MKSYQKDYMILSYYILFFLFTIIFEESLV